MSAARLVLGTAQWGGPYGIANRGGPPAAAERTRLLLRASAAGIRQVDTARAYGQSEARLAAALRASRTRFAIGTKLSPDVAPPGASAAEARARTEASLAASRRALGVERLDALLLHRAAHRQAAGGAVWERLRAEREAGRIACLGVSAASPAEAWEALDDPTVERIQVATSLLDQRLVRSGFFAAARARGVEVQVRSVFLQGAALLPPAALPPALAPLRAPLQHLRAFAAAHGLALSALLLGFAAALPGVSVVIGVDDALQLSAHLRAARAPARAASLAAAAAALVPPLPDAVLDPWRWPAAPHQSRESA